MDTAVLSGDTSTGEDFPVSSGIKMAGITAESRRYR